MERRQLLQGLAALTVLAPVLKGCDPEEAATDTGADTGFVDCVLDDAEGLGTESGHTHLVTIPETDIEAGVAGTYTSTLDDGHTHEVALTADDMVTLRDTCTVTVETSDAGHFHSWAISLPAD